MNRFFQRSGFYIIVILIIFGIIYYISGQEEQINELSYDQFAEQLANDNVGTLNMKFDNYSIAIQGELKELIEGSEIKTFISRAPYPSTDSFNELLENSTAVQTVEPMDTDGFWVTLLTSLLPFVIFFILFIILFQQSQGGGGRVMNFGKSKARLYSEEKKKVTFKDVAGADEEKQELVEVVEFLKDPRKFASLGARVPKGVLLNGPPGTGKTLLARAVAGEAGVPFFSISGSDFVEMFVGVGASRVRDLFENAKKNSPCIIFIDEIDAVGRQRGAGLGGGHDEREQTLNQLLVEMDGFGENENIIIIAATNRQDILDPALLRPGRFDRQITVDRPDVKGREAVLKVHAKNKPLRDDVTMESLARYTTGFTGADLENLLNEAALIAARRDKKQIDMDDLDEAFDRIVVGTQKKNRIISPREKKTVALHEAGHTIIGYHLQHADIVHKVTIVPRGKAGGYAMMMPKEGEDRLLQTKNELLDRVTGLLGGRVAEELFIGEVGTGAYDDFRKATAIVRSMVMQFGMSEKLGPIQFGNPNEQVFLGRDVGQDPNYSDAIAYEIDKELQKLMNSCYDRAKQILQDNADQVHLIANKLIELETLDKDKIYELLQSGEVTEPIDVYKDEPKDESNQNDVKVNIQSQKEEETNDDKTE
ncbi:ATP-dependent zinc metalloprotease FtsH [Longirhabdus pacifica]|uniref:ATP-dependent zinc metalloprotease FtsH n=1 Tax=Longirhabdus pacifica TaxID=2305227 RepID=UPI001008D01A|nr:ATP-dependent zinc metalloprotease FtsH [Longirhabdus pacifica]